MKICSHIAWDRGRLSLRAALQAQRPANAKYSPPPTRSSMNSRRRRGARRRLRSTRKSSAPAARGGASSRRLGAEANDALDEFLNLAFDYERRETPSLQGFVAWLREARAEVKRDMEIARDEVRVMTVHGAKGLEAPIVILADTMTPPAGPKPPRLLHACRQCRDLGRTQGRRCAAGRRGAAGSACREPPTNIAGCFTSP